MRPDPGLLVAALAGWTVLLLLLPKRGWRSIADRLRAAASGERSYVFGPPARTGGLESDYFERLLQLVRRELGRAVELGLPVYVAALAAELRGQSRRRQLEGEWHRSAAGLLLEHLEGRLDAGELSQQLHQTGQVPFAVKLTWEPPHQVLMPPMEWRLDWEQRLATASPGTSSEESRAATPSQEPHLLEVRTLGGLRLLAGEQDLTSGLLRRPVQSFVWLYLLVREIRKPGDRISRAALADELFTGLDPDQQRERLRKRLSEMHSLVPEPLAGRVQADGEYVSIDLSGCGLDAWQLLDLAKEAASAGELLPDGLADDVERILSAAREEFLPDWEEVERRATGARGVAGDLVREVRDSLAAAYVSLVSAIADSHLARRQPAKAIPHLEEALLRRPESEALALKLSAAYDQSGQPRAAARLREQHGLTEAS